MITVLCADGCPIRLRTIQWTLEGAGYKSYIAEDITSALSEAKRRGLKAILVHEELALQPEWQQLRKSLSMPVLQYGNMRTVADPFGSCKKQKVFTTWRPEMLLSLLTLLLSIPKNALHRTHQADEVEARTIRVSGVAIPES